MDEQKHIVDDKVTFGEIIEGLMAWSRVFLGRKLFILAVTLIGVALGIAASLIKKPVYVADTTFVLEGSDLTSLGNISGLASMIGLNIGSLGSESGLFKGDNIMELYKSQSMLDAALLSPFDSKDTSYLLVKRYIDFNKLESKWKRKVDFAKLDFNQPRDHFSVQQDSVLREISKLIRKKNLAVEKPDRKLNIIKVSIVSKDEPFSKVFNETLVEKVNQFYKETKTKKTAENLLILQSQADSVRAVLDQSLRAYARSQDQVPNPNPLLQQGTVETRSRQADIQASAAVYQEVVKNLEIAKISHRNNTPLIQIIDMPRYPLEESKIKLKEGIVVGAMVFFLGALFYVYLQTLFRRHTNSVDRQVF